MTESQLSGLAPVDLIAPFWFFACWAGYGLCADRLHGRHSLMRSMEAYRRLWMRHMLERDNRIVDSQIIDNLVRSSSFFASTALIIIGGLLAALGRSDQAVDLLHKLPIASLTARHFNGGMRAYYFGLAVLSWFIHPGCSCSRPPGSRGALPPRVPLAPARDARHARGCDHRLMEGRGRPKLSRSSLLSC
jgi:uncharacterized membrane protein